MFVILSEFQRINGNLETYHPNFTSGIFKIKDVKHSNPPHYKIKDVKGEEILGVWYESDLSIVRGDQIGQGHFTLFCPQILRCR